MPSPIIRSIETVTDDSVTVGAVTTVILAANSRRVNAVFVNDSNEVIYLARGNAAVLNEGIRLNASGGSYEINDDNLYLGAVNGICASGQKNITVSEGI